jgi:type IV secretory pathway VirJ component
MMLVCALGMLLAVLPSAASDGVSESSMRLPFVGTATTYMPAEAPENAVIFLSGDGGWNLGVIGMARRAARTLDAVVAGVSYPRLQKAALSEKLPCWCPACDLEEIGKSLEKQAGFTQYKPPILVGFSSGASLVYAALASSPTETFAGGMSLGFCPDLENVPRLCRHADWKPAYEAQHRRIDLPPVPELSRPWVVLQGTVDQVCHASKTESFVPSIRGATLSRLPGVGHGYGNEARWGTAFDAGLQQIATAAGAFDAESARNAVTVTAGAGEPGPGGTGAGAPAPDGAETPDTPPVRAAVGADAMKVDLQELDLPLEIHLVEHPRAYLLFISGDGGWSKLDKTITEHLATAKVAMVGLNTLKYFWSPKAPDVAAGDLRRILTRVRRAGVPVFSGGYSFGAEVIPFLAGRPEFLEPGFAGMILVAPGPFASWEVSPLDWIRHKEKVTPHKVLTQVQALGPLPVLCMAGQEDDESVCPGLQGQVARDVFILGGGHHFNGDYDILGEQAVRFIERLLK